MGMDNYSKFGFFFKAKDKVNQVKTTLLSRCSNQNCKNHHEKNMNNNFCSKCGEKIEKVELKEDAISFIKIQDFLYEHMDNSEIVYTVETLPDNIYLYNYQLKKDCLLGVISDSSDDDAFVDITDCDVKKSIETFSNLPKVKEFLDKFKEVYGESSIEVRLGFYSYWS